jgi:integrase
MEGSLGIKPMMKEMFVSIVDNVPRGTQDVNGRDLEKWTEIMTEMGFDPLRDDVASHKGQDLKGYWREVMIQAVVFFRTLKATKPKSKRLDPHGNLIAAKPDSVTVVKTMRRLHSYFGIEMAQSRMYANLLKAATKQFIEAHGLAALMPQRKQPFTNPELRRMVSVAVEGAQFYSLKVNPRSRFWRSVELLFHCATLTGFRLGDALRLNRDAVHFDFRGTLFAEAISDMVSVLDARAYALLTPGQTKSDPLGSYWSPFPVYLPCNRAAVLKPGVLLYEYDLDFHVPTERRAFEPLFTDDDGNRLTRPVLEKILDAWMVQAGVEPSTHSWHSFRIFLAVALKAAGADDARIKAMVRWVSDASLKIYARDSRKNYAEWLDKAACADVGSVHVASMPEMDDDQAMAKLHALLQGDGVE